MADFSFVLGTVQKKPRQKSKKKPKPQYVAFLTVTVRKISAMTW